MIEDAYRLASGLGRAVWCADPAGPFQTVPHPGQSWRPEGRPARLPHEDIRNGTAKVLPLFHPAIGHVRLKGVTSCPNAVLAGRPDPPPTADRSRAAWELWQVGLKERTTLPAESPTLRALPGLD